MRSAQIQRKTAETDIFLSLDLDGDGKSEIDTGVGFLDHMLTLFAKHGHFHLTIRCQGDLEVDAHHSVEDIGICLGQAIKEAVGDKKGIARYGSQILPMDEALILCAIDLSGRSVLRYGLSVPTEKIGEFDTELVCEFFESVARNGEMNLHLRQLDGENSHHIVEGAFKAFGRALSAAVAVDKNRIHEIPSTKGVL